MDLENFVSPTSKSPLEHKGDFLISKNGETYIIKNENLLCCY